MSEAELDAPADVQFTLVRNDLPMRVQRTLRLAPADSVEKMRTVPFGRRGLVMVLVPIAVPMLIAASTQIPIKDLLLKLVKAMM